MLKNNRFSQISIALALSFTSYSLSLGSDHIKMEIDTDPLFISHENIKRSTILDIKNIEDKLERINSRSNVTNSLDCYNSLECAISLHNFLDGQFEEPIPAETSKSIVKIKIATDETGNKFAILLDQTQNKQLSQNPVYFSATTLQNFNKCLGKIKLKEFNGVHYRCGILYFIKSNSMTDNNGHFINFYVTDNGYSRNIHIIDAQNLEINAINKYFNSRFKKENKNDIYIWLDDSENNQPQRKHIVPSEDLFGAPLNTESVDMETPLKKEIHSDSSINTPSKRILRKKAPVQYSQNDYDESVIETRTSINPKKKPRSNDQEKGNTPKKRKIDNTNIKPKEVALTSEELSEEIKSEISSKPNQIIDLSYKDLAGANLENTDLTGSNLQGVDFTGANLKGVDFTGANLQRATLRCANLTGATFNRANLTGANLTNANLTEANLLRATLKDLIGLQTAIIHNTLGLFIS